MNANILVIGHDSPPCSSMMSDKRVRFVTADFDPPTLTNVRDVDTHPKAQDKGKKVELGTKLAHASGAEWVMYCDADDLVSANLPYHCNFEASDAIVLGVGWQWSFGAPKMTKRYRFFSICGTSMLMRLTKKNFPSWLGGGETKVAECGHNHRVHALKEIGAVVQMLSQPLAVYTVNNGSNYYYDPLEGNNDALLRKIIRAAKRQIYTHQITDTLRREFSIPD